MKQLVKNCLTVLLVVCAALIFSLQLRWLSQKGLSRYSERERTALQVFVTTQQEESVQQASDNR
ncbi:MAG: hypothetical protein LUH41_01795 [Clostridiales bacterium]|nr:hypothetical protein [Clostridiales bacterium]